MIDWISNNSVQLLWFYLGGVFYIFQDVIRIGFYDNTLDESVKEAQDMGLVPDIDTSENAGGIYFGIVIGAALQSALWPVGVIGNWIMSIKKEKTRREDV